MIIEITYITMFVVNANIEIYKKGFNNFIDTSCDNLFTNCFLLSKLTKTVVSFT